MKRKYWNKIVVVLSVCGVLCACFSACKNHSVELPETHEPTEEVSSTEIPMMESTATEVSTTETPTTEVSTTETPTTEVSTTETPTTEVSTTEVPDTEIQTTEVPTTEAPTTEVPTTEAPTTEAPTVESVSAYVKGECYMGDTLSAADFVVTVTMSDGTVRKNPAGWSADVLYLENSETEITITYQGKSVVIVVTASERPKETEPPITEAPAQTQGQPSPESGSQPAGQDPGNSGNEQTLRRDAAEEAFRIQNDLIVQNGGTPLQWSETFYQQACVRAQEIVTNFSHDGFNNTTAYAENIAMGSYNANVMVQAWYNSDGHRNNMLYGWKYGAIACYGEYWVALFGPTDG